MKADKTSLQLIAQKSEGCLRDALSILDKISSFTNGELTYANTLEHLNILDEDYYFKLMDCMMQQDLSGALLLYNEIYKKGFEGDLVLDGFMEFIRNLLVCQDQKASVLLDVVENFKEKYRETAKKISPAFLVSALNILNETELHYKAARNKRLHLEMALIRLSYLQQAISLTSEGDHTIKKKRVDEARPVAFRNLTPIEIKSKNVDSRAKKSTPIPEARLTIETPAEKPKPINYQPAITTPPVNQVQENEPKPTSKTSLGALAKIREQVKSNGKGIGQKLNEPILFPKLEIAWKAIGCMLQEEKNPAYKSFELARLVLKDENSFTVFTANNLEQKFIEKERNKACSYLQQELRNTSIQFTIEIDDNMPKEALQEAPLSSSAQFAKMATQYPLVKELKDRLRLELDY
jgi:DNA polymerase-3 subunit gamma/tau